MITKIKDLFRRTLSTARVFSLFPLPSTLLGISLLFLLPSCDEQQAPDINDILSSDEQIEKSGNALQIKDIKFSDDYKVMELAALLSHDVGGYDLTDSSIVVATVQQHINRLINQMGGENQPVITQVSNSSREMFNLLDIKVLVLVDLSLPQQQIDAECKAVKEMKMLFDDQSLFVAFMSDNNVSETYEATDYILNNYFIHQDPSTIYLHRSVLTKLNEIEDANTTIGAAKRKIMVILSGGKTYEDEQPVDPMHFDLQQVLKDKAQTCKGFVQAYYANFSASVTEDQEILALSDNTNDTNILQYFCKSLDGLYQSSFNWMEIEEDILKDYRIDLSNYKIIIEQPDLKVFRGDIHILQVEFHDKKSGDLIAKGQTEFSLGSVYSPVIVRDGKMIIFIINGIILTLIILFLTWLTLHFLVPYIRYRIFKHKYVIHYAGNRMSFQGQPVLESCYLCKGPFNPGDEIVVKCRHTMHKECWDDNEYHCPEHGRHCKEGSHYYNPHQLLDKRNAPFYMKWILVAIVAGFTSWCLFVSRDHTSSAMIIDKMESLFGHSSADKGLNAFGTGSGLNDLPAFGLSVGFILTLFLANFTVRRGKWFHRLEEVLLRAVVSSIVGLLVCVFGCMISLFLHFSYSTFLTEWIPWALLSVFIMLAITFRTRTPVRRSFLIASFMIAVLTMFMWAFIYYNSFMDYRLSLLLGFIFYAVAIAMCVAYATPKSERFFLHVEGAIKEMDIALYKWYKASPNQTITIGKSVDCNIQLSWDINGQIAPVHAEISRAYGTLRLQALEEGVTLKSGKPLPVGKILWLYHGKSFTIGNTTFTYIEKDV